MERNRYEFGIDGGIPYAKSNDRRAKMYGRVEMDIYKMTKKEKYWFMRWCINMLDLMTRRELK